MSKSRPTPAEWEILNALWQLGPSTVRAVHEAIGASGYTTTLKLMQVMFDKGLVKRDESARAHLYTPKLKQESMQTDAAADLLDRVFGGSATALMQRALSRRRPNKAELDELRAMIDTFERGKA